MESLKLEEKKLSDFKLDHIVYMSVGSHLNETLEEIVERKNNEIRDYEKSLWAFSSGISETVFRLCNEQYQKGEDIYCVMINSGRETKTKDGKYAKYYEGSNKEIIEIPSKMKVSFAKKGDYALLVDQYYRIVGDNILYTKEYDYKEQYKYVRGFGFLNKMKIDINSINKRKCLPKKVAYIAKLKEPFLVKIFETNPNSV